MLINKNLLSQIVLEITSAFFRQRILTESIYGNIDDFLVFPNLAGVRTKLYSLIVVYIPEHSGSFYGMPQIPIFLWHCRRVLLIVYLH